MKGAVWPIWANLGWFNSRPGEEIETQNRPKEVRPLDDDDGDDVRAKCRTR